MKVIFISPSFYPANYYGGPIYSTYELAKEIKRKNIDIKVITTNANGKEKLKIKTGALHILENNLPVKYYNSLDSKGTSLSMFLNLWKVIKEADLIYLISVFSPTTPLTILICGILKKPIIISPNGQLGKWCLNQGNRFKKLWLKVFIKTFIKYLTWHLTSAEEQRDVKAVYPSAKTFVLPIGINLDPYKYIGINKEKLFYNKYSNDIDQNSKIIISMGRLQNVKGFDSLINSFKAVKEKFANSFLFIAGEDFGEKSNLLNLISSKNLIDRVFLIGHIEGEEKINFLKNADVFALSSHHENFGMVYGEALAAGTPIVASKNTPWQDVEKYNCGKWVENTVQEFAKAIIEILNSDYMQMSINGRKYVGENFSWDKIAVDFKRQIENVLNKGIDVK